MLDVRPLIHSFGAFSCWARMIARDRTMLARYHNAKVGFIPYNSIADNGERTAEKAAAAHDRRYMTAMAVAFRLLVY